MNNILNQIKWILPLEEVERISKMKNVTYPKQKILQFIDYTIELTKQNIELLKNEQSDFGKEILEKTKQALPQYYELKLSVEELDKEYFTFIY